MVSLMSSMLGLVERLTVINPYRQCTQVLSCVMLLLTDTDGGVVFPQILTTAVYVRIRIQSAVLYVCTYIYGT